MYPRMVDSVALYGRLRAAGSASTGEDAKVAERRFRPTWRGPMGLDIRTATCAHWLKPQSGSHRSASRDIGNVRRHGDTVHSKPLALPGNSPNWGPHSTTSTPAHQCAPLPTKRHPWQGSSAVRTSGIGTRRSPVRVRSPPPPFARNIAQLAEHRLCKSAVSVRLRMRGPSVLVNQLSFRFEFLFAYRKAPPRSRGALP